MPVAVDMYEGLGAREDGTYANLSDGDKDATGNPQAIVSYDAQPDPVVSQRAVVPYAERAAVTSGTTLHNARLNTARYGRRNNFTTPSVQYREDGTIARLDSDDEEYDNVHFDSAEDQRDFNAVVNAERVVHNLGDDDSIDEGASTRSRNQEEESSNIPTPRGIQGSTQPTDTPESRDTQGSSLPGNEPVINDNPFH